MGPGGLSGTFFGLLSAVEKDEGFLVPAVSPAFLRSDGLRGKEVGLSSVDCFGNLASTPLKGGLEGTLGWLAGAFRPSVSFFSPGGLLLGAGGTVGLSRIPA